MGIHGIYKEIGPGRKVALSKLAVDKFEASQRPFRIAIDTSIWLFQIQSGKGGVNPALRTFYYRLLRLITHGIHPLFVFDGPNKPPFKRNKRTGPNVASIPEFLAKQLLKQFGIPFHIAPGEAEAECALLQREGIVDAVLSEDVDTLMFGSGVTLRNWTLERERTYVNVYDARETAAASGLEREGMVLIALMSGGDYIPEGIPGCGPKTACEAARAGFGAELCSIARRDTAALATWRERLSHELVTNESKYFRTKHKSLKIPDDFPSAEILRYYTHPVVSPPDKLDRLRGVLKWDAELDFPQLRTFTAEAFDWTKLGGAKKFIRNLAPAVLIRELRLRALTPSTLPASTQEAEESALIKSIHGKRAHPANDGVPELRVAIKPIALVPIDLEAEEPDDEIPPLSDDEPLPPSDNEIDDDAAPRSPRKKRGLPTYDPNDLERLWVADAFVRAGVPSAVRTYEDGARPKQKKTAAPKTTKTGAPRAKRKTTKPAMPAGALNRFATAAKPNTSATASKRTDPPSSQPPASQPETIDLASSSPPPSSAPTRFTTTSNPSKPNPQPTSHPDTIDLLSPSPPRVRRSPFARTQSDLLPQSAKAKRTLHRPPLSPRRPRSPYTDDDLPDNPLLPPSSPLFFASPGALSPAAKRSKHARAQSAMGLASPGGRQAGITNFYARSDGSGRGQAGLDSIADASPLRAVGRGTLDLGGVGSPRKAARQTTLEVLRSSQASTVTLDLTGDASSRKPMRQGTLDLSGTSPRKPMRQAKLDAPHSSQASTATLVITDDVAPRTKAPRQRNLFSQHSHQPNTEAATAQIPAETPAFTDDTAPRKKAPRQRNLSSQRKTQPLPAEGEEPHDSTEMLDLTGDLSPPRSHPTSRPNPNRTSPEADIRGRRTPTPPPLPPAVSTRKRSTRRPDAGPPPPPPPRPTAPPRKTTRARARAELNLTGDADPPAAPTTQTTAARRRRAAPALHLTNAGALDSSTSPLTTSVSMSPTSGPLAAPALHPLAAAPRTPAPTRRARKMLIRLRESAEGRFAIEEEGMQGRGRTFRLSQVEVLDLVGEE
ncbi:hypothetical protein EJ06DRAFT_510790 [Trichodelitschia bisporula]|uniref:XPG-I domain-containing protein n=1 Tax=Trichodelitschia bisporula TaxID=703511 RepID=A0A6G1HXG3_9PEZI|nr:hypothetical protein EJ06DRAFT_510790 [Trichodelitschia bisporula]